MTAKSLDRIKEAAKDVCSRDTWRSVHVDLVIHTLGVVVKAKSGSLTLTNIVLWNDLADAQANPLLEMIKYMDKTLGGEE